MADHLPVEDRLLERHRDVILGLEANRRLELAVVLDQWQAKGPHRHPLVRESHPNGLRELVTGEQLLERVPQRLGVGYLALAEDAGAKRDHAELRNR